MTLARSGLGGFLIGLFLAAHSNAANYYVSTAGNDANAGTSPSTAWRTVQNVAKKRFSAGDRILFEGHEVFRGKLVFDASDSGNASNPIVISSYGLGRATIFAGLENAVSGYNCGGIVISNINFLGSGARINHSDGISFYNDLPNGEKLPGVSIDRVEVSGFGGCGIAAGGWNEQAGYENLQITGVSAHDNLRAGILIYAQEPNANRDVYVGACKAYNNFGDPTASGNTGNGIVLGCVQRGVVERCVAHNNGKHNYSPHEGPAGIWAYNSSQIIIQFNESHHNHSGGKKDGVGFDLDINVTDSLMQNNYAHENDGAGFMLCANGQHSGSIVRYNISQNDARKNHYGAIHIYASGDAQIYNNTIFLTPGMNSPAGLMIETTSNDIRIRNNIFQTTGGVPLLDLAVGQANLQVQGNNYWSTGAPFRILDGGKTFQSLEQWQNSTDRERNKGLVCGLNVNPKLTKPGQGGTFNNSWLLDKLSAYKLLPNSILIGAGLDVRLLEEDTALLDFYGTPVPQRSSFDIGAHEFVYPGIYF